MTVRAYLRVSSTQQADQGHSLLAQRDKTTAWATYQGLPSPVFYEDRGVSGRRDDRPELLRLLDDLTPGDVVVVYALSRLGRGGAVQLLGIVRQIEQAGARLVSLTENIDTVTPAGRLLLTILAALTEMELEVTQERITAGRENAASRGLWPHASINLPTGWTRAEDGRLIESEYADLVRDMFRWAAEEGLTPYAISDRLRAEGRTSVRGKFMSAQSIRRLLATPAYHTGVYHYRRHARPHEPATWMAIPVPPLVTEAQWQAAQRPPRGNPNVRRPDLYPLTGHLRCACGGPMNGGRAARKTGWKYTYGCRMGSRGTPKCPASGRTNTEVVVAVAEARARAALVETLGSEAAVRALLTPPEPVTDPHRGERAELERRREALIDLHLEGLIDRPEFLRRRDDLSARIERLRPQVTAPLPDMALVAGYRTAAASLEGEDYAALLRELRVRFEVAPDGTVTVQELSVPI